MRTHVFWVAGMRKGRLGILPRPRGGDWLADETAAWREAGVEMVVSLLEPDEAAQLVLEDEAAAAASSGIAFRAFPIPDRDVPSSKESVGPVSSLAPVLVAMGTRPDAAVKTVGDARGLEVPETKEQRQWLEEFAAWLASTTAANSGMQPTAPRDRPRRG